MAATITDVAAAAGVSPSTVSRSFTSPSLVNAGTLGRIHEVAERLGYRPNLAARGLITGRTSNVGMIVPDLSNPYFATIVQSAEARARASGYFVLLADTGEDARNEVEFIHALTKQVDGVIVCSSRMTRSQLSGVMGTTPLVFLNEPVADSPSVLVDPADGVEEALDHLAGLGHRDCLYLGGPRRSWANRRRLERLRSTGKRLGLHVDVGGPYQPHFRGGADAVREVLASGVTSVIAFNDLMAIGLMNALDRHAIPVPDQISVVGSDDLEIAAMFTPSLTTTRPPLEEAGASLVDLLLGGLEDGDRVTPVRELLPTSLVVRGSTGPPPVMPVPDKSGT